MGHEPHMRVLVVDDEPAVCMLLEEVIGEGGHVVTTAENVTTAVELLGEGQFDLIFSDKNLPDGTGLDIAAVVSERNLDCEMAIVTAFGSLQSAIEAMRLGVSEYLEKPFRDLEVLRACLARMTRVQSLKRENRTLIQTLKEQNTILGEMSVRDPLTQLYNHAFLQESLEREVQRAERHRLEFSLLFIDLDNFKQVNDTCGHRAGDLLLKHLAGLMSGGGRRSDTTYRFRAQDIAARYGGDEFALLLPETPKRGAITKAERLRASLEEWDSAEIGIPSQTISVGVASFPVDAKTRAGLIDAADAALYAAKSDGRNRMVAYTEALQQLKARGEALDDELQRIRALETSIESEAFDFVYQRIVDADSGKVFAFEALCRPRNPAFPDPSLLFSTAERAGRVRDLGRVIRRCAMRDIELLPEGSLLFMNLHPNELHDPDLVSVEPHMAPWTKRVVLEVTDVASIADTQRLKVTLARLAAAGFRIALDDLGSGYSGLNSLAILEPDFVKLDMQLVRRINTDARVRRLAKHVIEFANGEGMQAVAKGIETEPERTTLVELGCPLLQGFLFGGGEPASQVAVCQ
jgi:diguanylate cyclase (GGDEF)-like protein